MFFLLEIDCLYVIYKGWEHWLPSSDWCPPHRSQNPVQPRSRSRHEGQLMYSEVDGLCGRMNGFSSKFWITSSCGVISFRSWQLLSSSMSFIPPYYKIHGGLNNSWRILTGIIRSNLLRDGFLLLESYLVSVTLPTAASPFEVGIFLSECNSRTVLGLISGNVFIRRHSSSAPWLARILIEKQPNSNRFS